MLSNGPKIAKNGLIAENVLTLLKMALNGLKLLKMAIKRLKLVSNGLKWLEID